MYVSSWDEGSSIRFEEMVALELYVTSFANGAAIEVPGLVR